MPSFQPAGSNTVACGAPVDRRRHARFPFSAAVEAAEIKSGARITGRTTEISLGGCYVDTQSPFPIGAEVRIRICREKESFEAHARVVYSTIGSGMGLAFTAAQPKQVQVFQSWMKELRNGSIAASPATAGGESVCPSGQGQETFKNVVMSDLIMTLMQKDVLTDAEGKNLLRILFKQ